MAAALFWNSRNMELSSALANVGELKGVIANTLSGIGFSSVVNTPSEVAGDRNGVRVSIAHLHIAGTQYWQVFMAAGDAANVTQATLNEVVNKVEHLKFL
jgi:hypothetical protein